jgi:hypothetical protein
MDKLTAILARVQGKRVYLDTNVFIYFLDRHDLYFDVVLPFFQLFNEGLSFAYTGVDILPALERRGFLLQDGNVLPHTSPSH